MITAGDLWAKTDPYESLISHLLRAGLVCKTALTHTSLTYVWNILRENISGIDDANLLNLLSYSVAMHDIGKAAPFFQAYSAEFKAKLKEDDLLCATHIGDNYYHEKQSGEYLYELLLKHGVIKHIEAFMCVASTHHMRVGTKNGTSLDFTELPRSQQHIGEKWLGFVNELESVVFNKFNFKWDDTMVIFKNKDVFFHYLWGLTIISDWLSSNDEFRCISLSNGFNDQVEFIEKLHKFGFIDTEYRWEDVEYNQLLGGDTDLRPLQQWSLDNIGKNKKDYGLLILEAGTGEGKTSAGLYSAFQVMGVRDGFYYALPMKVMVEAKYMELKSILKEAHLPLHLLHGSRLLLDDVDQDTFYYDICKGDTSYSWERKEDSNYIAISNYLLHNSRLGLFNKYLVGTVDQLLQSVLPNRFSILSLLGLAGKVLILDELHMYDAYTSTLICSLLTWCKALNIRVILMSATLTKSLKERYIKAYLGDDYKGNLVSDTYPTYTVVNSGEKEVQEFGIQGSVVEKEERVQLLPYMTCKGAVRKQAESILIPFNKECNVVVYKNTVKSAQKLYEECIALGVEKSSILLCHSKFTLQDRHGKEAEVLRLFGKNTYSRPKKFIVICTQVFEACLDIDFDVCFSDLAPMDILVQRWGRKCRFQLETSSGCRGDNYVFIGCNCMDFDDSKYVYYEFNLAQTYLFLTNLNGKSLSLPSDLRECIKCVYGDIDTTNNGISDLYINKTISDNIKSRRGKVATISEPKVNNFSLEKNILGEVFEADTGLSEKTRLFNEKKIVILLDNNFPLVYTMDKLKLSDYKTLMKSSVELSDSSLELLGVWEDTGVLKPTDGLLKGALVLNLVGGVYQSGNGKILLYSTEEGIKIEKGEKDGL